MFDFLKNIFKEPEYKLFVCWECRPDHYFMKAQMGKYYCLSCNRPYKDGVFGTKKKM